MYAVIYLPDFCLQAVLRSEPVDGPVAITDGESSKTFIFQVNHAASGYGVTPGLTASQAMARCGQLTIKSRSRPLETKATEILLQVAYNFSAIIESTDLGVCTLELKGLSLTELAARRAWAEKILETLARLGLKGRVGYAPAPELARLAAHMADPILDVKDTAAFLAQLPVRMLNPSPHILEILEIWGIQTMGALIALGKDHVVERLGEEASELFERTSLTAVRPLKPVVPPEIFSEEMQFENGVDTILPLLNVLQDFLKDLTNRLSAVHLVAGELYLELGLVSGDKLQKYFKIPEPTNKYEILFRSLRTWLETLQSNSEVSSIVLQMQPTRATNHQYGLFETTLRDPNQFFETVAQLSALCGTDRVGSPCLEPTHCPDAFHLRIPRFDTSAAGHQIASPDLIKNQGPALRRFRPLVSLAIEGIKQPQRLHSRLVKGPVCRAKGPYLSSGQWWENGGWHREEWDVEMADGACYRILRSAEGDFVEGIYD